MLFTPWQQVMFDAAVAEAVRDLISGTTIALWNMEQLFQVTDIKVRHAQARIFPPERRFSKPVTTPEKSVIPFGQADGSWPWSWPREKKWRRRLFF
jgi:hypothetical protein